MEAIKADTRPIRILVVDDHEVVRNGLAMLLDVKPGVEVVGDAADGREAIEKAQALQPDVILLDLVMPNKDGIAVIKEVQQLRLPCKVLVLTSFTQEDLAFEAVLAGAHGYQLKESSTANLLHAIKAVYNNQTPIHPAINRSILRRLQQPKPTLAESAASQPEDELTEREIAVLKRIALGDSNQEIAQKLNISERTVTTHVSNILSKLQVDNRTRAAVYAIRIGLIDLDEDA